LASFLYFQAAVEDARKGKIQALVTSPISKASWALAGVRWKGHTDYLSRFYPGAIMTFWSDRLKVALFTHHLSLRAALKKVSRENLERFFISLHRSLKKVNPGGFEFLVAGLNPHAGEEGILGHEEREAVEPAIEMARAKGIDVVGPFPPDNVFVKARDGAFDLTLALYHDQGLIAAKLLGFGSVVTLLAGLPFVRTSVGHGTAFDIAGTGRADHRNMIEAIRVAADIGARRRHGIGCGASRERT
jgi:4-hydroxythreonine-4-phosphate dehydrogenase